MEDEERTISIYIMPTEPMKPPRAIVGEFEHDEDGYPSFAMGIEVIWSSDRGEWLCGNCGRAHFPQELQEALTERAKELGVEW